MEQTACPLPESESIAVPETLSHLIIAEFEEVFVATPLADSTLYGIDLYKSLDYVYKVDCNIVM